MTAGWSTARSFEDFQSAPPVSVGLAKSIKYLADYILLSSHYGKLHASLATKWNSHSSLQAALKLFAEHRVHLSLDEQHDLVTMDQEQMIDTLIARLPKLSPEESQGFTRKLRGVVQAAMAIQQAVEQGGAEQADMAILSAENTGVDSYILKMACMQAGSHVLILKEESAQWAQAMAAGLEEHMRSEVDLRIIKRKLAEAEAQLSQSQAMQRACATKVLPCVAANRETVAVRLCIGAWSWLVKFKVAEDKLFHEQQKLIEQAKRTMLESSEHQSCAIRRLVERSSGKQDMRLVATCFAMLQDQVKAKKGERNATAVVGAMQARFHDTSDGQAQNARKVVSRLVAGIEFVLRAIAWKAWRLDLTETRKEQEQERAIALAEADVEKFIEAKNKARGLMVRLHASNHRGCMYRTIKQWVEVCRERRHRKDMAEVLRQSQRRLTVLVNQESFLARTTMQRVKLHLETLLLLRVLMRWKLHRKLDRIRSQNEKSLESKRKQLSKVHNLFRQFANQLQESMQTNLQDTCPDWANLRHSSQQLPLQPQSQRFSHGSPSNMEKAPATPQRSRRHLKREGTVSLPAIAGGSRSPEGRGRRGGLLRHRHHQLDEAWH